MRNFVNQKSPLAMSLHRWLNMSVFASMSALSLAAAAVDQTVVGAGNNTAATLAYRSPLVRSAYQLVVQNAHGIGDERLRKQTVDALENPATCIAHRVRVSPTVKAAIVRQLTAENLVSTKDDATFPGGLSAGIFPPVVQDGLACPTLPQPFYAAPGSVFGGHHSQPGGLAVHEALNDLSSLSLRDNYQAVYGTLAADGLPVVRHIKTAGNPEQEGREQERGDNKEKSGSALRIDRDLMVTAPLWHDWAKTIVFQWNADGSEFQELNFGGNGTTDNYGLPGDSKTGAHHILGLAETMKRGLSPEFVITQASAHSVPSLGNEYKVVNWLRAAAIIAQIDPVAQGYLAYDKQNKLRLPAVRRLGEADLNNATPTQTNLLVEYVLHNLSDADFTFTGPALKDVEMLLKKIAPEYGYDPVDVATFNNRFRNPALSFLSAERLYIIFADKGMDGLRRELDKLRKINVI